MSPEPSASGPTILPTSAKWWHYDERIGGFRADAALHRTNALAGTSTHLVDDRI